MAKTGLVIHLPTHREHALQSEGNTREAVQAYDANIGAYIEFLRGEGRRAGFDVSTDQRALAAVFSIDETTHDEKKLAHAWLEKQPSIWDWLP